MRKWRWGERGRGEVVEKEEEDSSERRIFWSLLCVLFCEMSYVREKSSHYWRRLDYKRATHLTADEKLYCTALLVFLFLLLSLFLILLTLVSFHYCEWRTYLNYSPCWSFTVCTYTVIPVHPHAFVYLSTCVCVFCPGVILIYMWIQHEYTVRNEDKNNSAQYEVKIAVELKSCFLLAWANKDDDVVNMMNRTPI